MKRVLVSMLVVSTVFASGTIFAGEVNMDPGLWEITTVMEMTGMPVQPPPNKTTHCYTEEEINQAGVIPDQQGDCTVTDLRQTADGMTWKVACTGESQGRGEGEIVFRGPRTYEGKMRFESQGMTLSSTYTGRRIGDCP